MSNNSLLLVSTGQGSKYYQIYIQDSLCGMGRALDFIKIQFDTMKCDKNTVENWEDVTITRLRDEKTFKNTKPLFTLNDAIEENENNPNEHEEDCNGGRNCDCPPFEEIRWKMDYEFPTAEYLYSKTLEL